MAFKIHFEGDDVLDKDDGLAKNAHDTAIRDKALAFYNDIVRLSGSRLKTATVETTSTDKQDFLPTTDTDDDGA